MTVAGPIDLPNYARRIFSTGWIMSWKEPVKTRAEFEAKVRRIDYAPHDKFNLRYQFGYTPHMFYGQRDDGKWLFVHENSPEGRQQFAWFVAPQHPFKGQPHWGCAAPEGISRRERTGDGYPVEGPLPVRQRRVPRV